MMTQKIKGHIKKAYVICPGCGAKIFFGPHVLPGGSVDISFINGVNQEEEPIITVMCGKCKDSIVMGLACEPTIRDN